MATLPGALFIRKASAPLVGARTLFERGDAERALRTLDAAQLRAAMRGALHTVASAAWVSANDVEKRLDAPAIGTCLVALSSARDAAVNALAKVGPAAEGFRPPRGLSACDNARALAAHLADRAGSPEGAEAAAAVAGLAGDLAAWDTLIERSGRRLDDDRALSESFRRARWLRTLTGVALSVVTIAAALLGYVSVERAHRARPRRVDPGPALAVVAATNERIDRAMSVADPCKATLSPEDRARASEAQRTRYVMRARECDAQIARAEHEARCRALADDVTARKPARGEDITTAQAELLQRAAVGKLERRDLLARATDIPCADTPSSAVLWGILADAAARSGETFWSNVEVVSPELAEAIRARTPPLEPSARAALAVHSEHLATTMLLKGDGAGMARARALCAFKEGIGIAPEWQCRKLLRHHGRGPE